MTLVKLKNGMTRDVPEQAAINLEKRHGATIIGKVSVGKQEVPYELQKTKLITELPEFAKQIEVLRAENDKLIQVNKKQTLDIVALMNEINTLKDGKTIQIDPKESKAGKKTINPNS